MAKKALFLNTGDIEGFWEGVEYTPPKNAVDIGNFNDFLTAGSFSLPDFKILEGEREFNLSGSPKEFLFKEETPPAPVKMSFAKQEPIEADRFSVADSLKAGAYTATTASPESTYSTRSGHLSKRSPKKSDWMTLKVQENEDLQSNTVDMGNDKNVFVNTIFGTDIANERITKLALRLIDQAGPIRDHEWFMLSVLDRIILTTYLAQMYSLSLLTQSNFDSPAELNQLLSVKLKGRRNEEKLNKTVKRVNAMIARSFADLNGLDDVDDETLSGVLQAAYFGEIDESKVFGINTVFSQKSFGKAVENARYAEDFKAVLKSSYIGELLRSRHQKVLKEVKSLRKSLQDGRDPALQLDHSKRSPWLLEDIIDGAKLCQNIIDRRRVG